LNPSLLCVYINEEPNWGECQMSSDLFSYTGKGVKVAVVDDGICQECDEIGDIAGGVRYEQLWEELHAIAQKHKIFYDWKQPWLRPRYFKTFQHYATAILTGNSKVRISSYGEMMFKKEELPRWYEEMNSRLSRQLIQDILNLTADWVSISYLEKQVCRQNGCSKESFLCNLLWMIKYNLLDLRHKIDSNLGGGIERAIHRRRSGRGDVERR